MTPEAERLAAILSRVDARPLRDASPEDLHALPGLYRTVVAQLAEVRAREDAASNHRALEALVMGAHGVLYAPPALRLGVGFAALVRDFPTTVQRSARYVALAVAVTTFGAAWGYLEVRRDQTSAAVFLSEGWEQNAEGFQDGAQREGSPLRAPAYFTNNARVALNAFAFGATFGIGTVLVLLYNGILLGATTAVVGRVGSLHALMSFILPHSGIELMAIFIAAAAGLRLADAMLRPGWRSRLDAMKWAARDSLEMALGAAAILAVAGLIEGWVSPMAWPLAIKAAIGLTLDAGLVAYLLSGRRQARAAPLSA